MQDHIFMGAATALVTSFDKEGRVNYPKLRELIEYQLGNGCDALLLCGTTGECSTLSKIEKSSIIAFAKEVINGRVPLIAGAGTTVLLKPHRNAETWRKWARMPCFDYPLLQ